MARIIIGLVLQDDGRWVKLVGASDMYGLAELGFSNFTGFTHGRDSLLLIDFRHTPGTNWSKARNRGHHSVHDLILREIRRLYIALHRI